MEKALVLVFSNLKHDARVMRQISWLTKLYQVTVVCFDANEIPGVRVIKVTQTPLTIPRKLMLASVLLLRIYPLAYKLFHSYQYLIDRFANENFGLIVANDIDTLPLAFDIKGQTNTPIVFDAHEYAPRHFENNKIWKTFFQPFYIHLCKKYIPRTSRMLTVGQGLANEYKTNFGIQPVIITNATRYSEIDPVPVQADRIRLIHHGIANQSRRLELMLEMMSNLDNRFTLDLILMTSDYASANTKSYIANFKKQAETDGRIRVLPGVSSDQVVKTINHYDIGVFLIPPINFNYANTLPNKLFDYIQARLGIAIGPTPEMAKIVNQYNVGVVAEDFNPATLAKKLNALTHEQIIQFKTNAITAARSLNAEKNENVFLNVLREIGQR